MKHGILLLLTMSIFGFFSCKSTYSPESYKKEQLRFGSGGGFTGAVTEYCLLSSGHIYLKNEGDTTFSQVNKISKADAKAIFTEAAEKSIPSYKLKESYNMYKFITYKSPDGENNLVWGIEDGSKKGDPMLAAFHARLMGIINPSE